MILLADYSDCAKDKTSQISIDSKLNQRSLST